jgi:hypothetical protein
LKFGQGINVQALIVAHRLDSTLEGIITSGEMGPNSYVISLMRVCMTEQEKLLQQLPGSRLDGVRYNESKACLDGTRQQLLRDIRTWVDSPNQKRIL